VIRIFLHELRAQQRLFWRSREAAFFTFLLPILLLVLIGSVYRDETIDGVDAAAYLVAGMLGFSVVATAFAGLAISLVIRRESGVLKRVRGTPMPPWLYLSAVFASTALVIALQAVTQVAIGRYLLGAGSPASLAGVAIALVVGAAAFAALGLAITGLVRGSEGSSAVINAVYLPMTFISGTFFSVSTMPRVLEALAEVLPLTYLLRVLRDLFIGAETLGGSLGSLAVLLAWGAIGVAIATKSLRWEPRSG
jgi:ABC-2 type transport system permease protein